MKKEPCRVRPPSGGMSAGQYNYWKDGKTEVHLKVEEWPEWKTRRLAEILFGGLVERSANESAPPAE
ncbi:hypothetical protein [Kitasatospora sp. LaBMicrA B282]|uniref:hypothetical protein n=1 Tax=Kitasatospora sp. LaBMicrA B282 TaxID=3420949 RepID=UPI003D0C56A7